MGIEHVDSDGFKMDMTAEPINPPTPPQHPDTYLFEDTFPPDTPPLTDMFFDSLKKQDDSIVLPIPVYAFRNRLYAIERNTTIEPNSFHQASSFGVKPAEIVEIATAHHQKLRDLGMTVVGHQFEIVDPDDERFETYQDHPTILTGAKLPYIPPREGSNSTPTFTMLGSDIKQKLESLRVKQQEFVTTVVDPIEAYLEWCGTSNQEYVLSWLTDTLGYFHHNPTGKIALQKVSTSLGSIELGNLGSRENDLKFFKGHLKKQGILA